MFIFIRRKKSASDLWVEAVFDKEPDTYTGQAGWFLPGIFFPVFGAAGNTDIGNLQYGCLHARHIFINGRRVSPGSGVLARYSADRSSDRLIF